MTSFDWIEDADLVPIYRVSQGSICGYLAEGFPGKPGVLHMQFQCPACTERQDLAVHCTAQIRFVVNATEFYDMRDAVVRDSEGSQLYDHRDNAIKRLTFRGNKHFKAMKPLRFSFIHECPECTRRFDVAICWSGGREGFELRLWYTREPNLTENPAFKKIDQVEAWFFGGDEALRLSTAEAAQIWAEEKMSLGVTGKRAHVQGQILDC
jgi:hypothetical protein